MTELNASLASNFIRIPPFIDSHIHFAVDGIPARNEEIVKAAGSMIGSGILSVMDCGHKSGIGLEAKTLLFENNSLLKVNTAGRAIYKKGGYGVFLGIGVSDRSEAEEAVRGIANSGADFLKIVNSGIVHFKDNAYVTPGGFDSEMLRIICEEANEYGLMVKCHANSDSAIRVALASGVSSIEHGFFISKETLHMMAEKKASWTPTIFAMAALSEGSSPQIKKLIDEVVENHLIALNYAASIGVPLAVGTDSGSKGVRHGAAFFEELRFFSKAGISLEKILTAACMGEHEIEKGNYLLADKDFINTGKLQSVFCNGIHLT
ncbi:MAG: amidohydrolase family protein [Nitrospirae bacterium]|nr:amidohydrolase family protein [Nitrospirota bacterium]